MSEQTPSLKSQIASANDALKAKKADFYQGRATLEDVRAAARRVLELRVEAEKAFYGRAKTKITPIAIAHLCR